MSKVASYREQINGKEFLIEGSIFPDVQLCHSSGLTKISGTDLSKNLWEDWTKGEEE